MAIKPYRGNFHTEHYPKKVSTAFTVGDLVYLDGNGYLDRCTSTTATALGCIGITVASTDSDYASATMVSVEVPDVDAEFLCDTSGAAQTDVGEFIDLTDHDTVDVAASTYDIFYVTGYVSATQVIAKLTKKSGAAAG